jgi:hypothetical protein
MRIAGKNHSNERCQEVGAAAEQSLGDPAGRPVD